MDINDILKLAKTFDDQTQTERDQEEGERQRKFLENATMWDVTSDELEGLWKEPRFKKVLKLLRDAWYGQKPDQPRVGTVWMGNVPGNDSKWFQIHMSFRTDVDEKEFKDIFKE